MAKLLHLDTPLEKTGNDFGVEIPEEINTDLRDIVLTEEMLAKGDRLMDMNLPKGMLVMLVKGERIHDPQWLSATACR